MTIRTEGELYDCCIVLWMFLWTIQPGKPSPELVGEMVETLRASACKSITTARIHGVLQAARLDLTAAMVPPWQEQ